MTIKNCDLIWTVAEIESCNMSHVGHCGHFINFSFILGELREKKAAHLGCSTVK